MGEPTVGEENELGLGATLKKIFENLSSPQQERNTKLCDIWSKVVGKKWVSETTPRLRDKTLVVWVKNSALACEMNQKYAPTILKRIQNELGEKEVEKIWFAVGCPRQGSVAGNPHGESVVGNPRQGKI